MIIANYVITHTALDKLWMVVTPHNPHKEKKSLARDYDRLHLLTLAIGDNFDILPSDIEFKLPKPSYTIDTLTYLGEKYPQHTFSLIMGGDNLASLHKWKNYEKIIENYDIYVYKRPTHELPELAEKANITILDAPLLSISSSYIRSLIAQKKSIRYLVPETVYDYLNDVPIYRNLVNQ